MKTSKQLLKEIKYHQKFIDKYPQFTYGWLNEHIQNLKAQAAEKVGKK